MQKLPVTVIEFLNTSADYLKNNSINDPRLNAELFLCDILNCNRMSLYLNFDKPLSKKEIALLNDYIDRRIKNEPLQYILGKTSFYGLDFKLSRKVLIPRPETEILVEKILDDIREINKDRISIFEIGSGSGCISIALAKNLEKSNTECDIFSIDISKDAIKIANENSEINNIENKKVRFIEKDVFEIERLKKSFDYIVSNPPYISLNDYNLLDPEVKNFEPGHALTDFDNGLKYYKKIFALASDKEFNGKVFCEIGFMQKTRIESILDEYKFNHRIFYKDYNNIDRVLEAGK